MEFKGLTLNNFMSYREARFDNIDHAGLTLIEGVNLDEGGSNGAGKSSLWDGISWSLFGLTVRGLKGDEVINRQAKKNCYASLALTFQGKNIVVNRYRKHDERGDRLQVDFANDDWEITDTKEFGTLAQTQDWIHEYFGIDFELFRCTVLFAQGETFNFVNAGNKLQKEILSKVMKVNYDTYLDNAKAKYKEMAQEKDTITRDLEVLKSHVVEDPDSIFAEEIESWEENRRLREGQIVSDLKLKKAKLAEMPEVDLSKLREMAAKIKEEGDTLKEHRRTISSGLAKAEGDFRFFQKQRSEFLALAKEGVCPTCHQDINEDANTSFVAKAEEGIKEAQAAISSTKSKIERLEGFMEANAKRLSKVTEAISQKAADQRIREHLQAEIERLEKSIARVKEENNPFIAKRDEAIKKQDKIKQKLESFAQRLKKIEDELPYYDFWVNAFGDSGIKSFVFDLVCSTLTNKSNDYLNLLTNGSIAVSFDTQKKLKSGELREKFDCSVMKDGEIVKYDAYSGGEKRRISLAVDMALSDLMSDYHGSRFNMVVFDEQTSYLDLQGRQGFMQLLKKLAINKRVFVVDHDSEFKAQFDDVWTIQKKSGVSQCLQ